MKHATTQHALTPCRVKTGAQTVLRRFALLLTMLLTLFQLSTRMVAQNDYDTSVTLKGIEAQSREVWNPDEKFTSLFDGKKTADNHSKWCAQLTHNGNAYVIFEASKVGIPIGYTITTGNDNSEFRGRNPRSWKLYGNNEGKDGEWELIDEVTDDDVLQDVDYTSYDYTCSGLYAYKYFKWEITAIQADGTFQVEEFELKLVTCTHTNADGSSALGPTLGTVPSTCTKHGYTTHYCPLCKRNINVKLSQLQPHQLVYKDAKAATCTQKGNIEHWQCSVCSKTFIDADAATETTDITIRAKGHQCDKTGLCSVCGATDNRYAQFLLDEPITIAAITDTDDYPWQVMSLTNGGNFGGYFTIPTDAKGVMSSNRGVDNSTSTSTIRFESTKTFLLSFDYACSVFNNNTSYTIFIDGNSIGQINRNEARHRNLLLAA